MAGERIKLMLARGGSAPSVAYPPGVIAAGLESVWDIRSTVGPTQSSLYTLPADAAQLPAGSSVSGSDVNLPSSGTYSISRFTFPNYNVYVSGSSTGILSQMRMTPSQAPIFGRMLGVSTSGSTTFTITDSDLNATGLSNASAPSLFFYDGAQGGTNVVIQRSRFWGASQIGMKTFGDSFLMEDCFVGTFLVDPAPEAHGESLFVDRGNVTIRRTKFDPTDFPINPSFWTGLIYMEGHGYGDITALMEDCVLVGPVAIGAAEAMQVSARANNSPSLGRNISLTVTGCAIQKGTGGGGVYIRVTQESGGVVTIIDGGGNYDLDTGALITSFT